MTSLLTRAQRIVDLGTAANLPAMIAKLKDIDAYHEAAARDADQIAAKLIEAEAVLQRIANMIPALTDGGGMHVEHHDQDGNYIGSENVDPMAVIQGMEAEARAFLATLHQDGERT